MQPGKLRSEPVVVMQMQGEELWTTGEELFPATISMKGLGKE